VLCQTAGSVVSFIHSNKQKDRLRAAFSEVIGKGDLRGLNAIWFFRRYAMKLLLFLTRNVGSGPDSDIVCGSTHSITSGQRLGLPVGGPNFEASARGDGLTKRSLGCACRAFQSHHSSAPTGCRCRILIRELIAVDRDETLLIRIVPSGKAAADNK